MKQRLSLLLIAIWVAGCSTPGTGELPDVPVVTHDGAKVRFEPHELNFARTLEGECRPHKVVVINQSGAPIPSPGFSLEGDSVFMVQDHFRDCPDPLADGDTCRVYVNFCPPFGETYRGKLVFTPTGEYAAISGRGHQHK